MIDPVVKKEIVRNLHSAIDAEISNAEERAYSFYVESLSLVADALKGDSQTPTLTPKDRWHLIEFAKQSVARVCILLKKEEPTTDSSIVDNAIRPSAPPVERIDRDSENTPTIDSPSTEQSQSLDPIMMARYRRRLGLATSALENHSVEVELARQIVEKEVATRNRLMKLTAWALEKAHRKFEITKKLQSGKLHETDFKKQQLFALSVQSNEGNSWLLQLSNELSLYPFNEKLVREILDNVLTDSSHPVKATLIQMQEKVQVMINEAVENSYKNDRESIEKISAVIKEDICIIQDVLKALFEPLLSERNSAITSEVVYHIYFSTLKHCLIRLIRKNTLRDEEKLAEKINLYGSGGTCEYWEKEAVTKLHYLTTLHNPYDMLDCTVHIIKILATTQFDSDHCTSIGADDLLPRLCHIVLSSRIPAMCSDALFMELFMPADKALGEEGYAVTMLQSAIAHLISDNY